MSKLRLETRGARPLLPFDTFTLYNSVPKTRATMSIPTRTAVRVGWGLFWMALWGVIRRQKSIDVWLEGET